jgi:hypothetical protein
MSAVPTFLLAMMVSFTPRSRHFACSCTARNSRGTDHWDKDDKDVRLGDGSGPVVGRIMRHPQAPEAQPWFWTITAREIPPSVPQSRIFSDTMADFKARWQCEMPLASFSMACRGASLCGSYALPRTAPSCVTFRCSFALYAPPQGIHKVHDII